MALTLQIENYDVLEDGGPVHITVNQSGLQAGRGAGMDWVLPDPSRHISGRHLEISYSNNTYWLTDVSTNGTFLKGQRYRLDGAHKLTHGDRFQVGHYIIVARLDAPPPTVSPASIEMDNPWDIGGVESDPINPLPRPSEHLYNDFSDDFIANPEPSGFDPKLVQTPSPDAAGSHLGFSPQQKVAPMAPPSTSQMESAPPPVSATEPSGFFNAFCEGIGLPADAYECIEPDVLARELGQSLRVVTEEIITLLRDRASAKQFTKGGERTMRSASDNNPLKFLPDTDQVLEAMYLKPRAGFLTGKDGLSEALKDIRLHQAAVFAAIQPALSKLLRDLAPEEISNSNDSGMLSRGKRAKAWDTYVERWDAKAHPHENGILDEFLSHFAEAYADMTKNSR